MKRRRGENRLARSAPPREPGEHPGARRPSAGAASPTSDGTYWQDAPSSTLLWIERLSMQIPTQADRPPRESDPNRASRARRIRRVATFVLATLLGVGADAGGTAAGERR